jgi:hypothetical protein
MAFMAADYLKSVLKRLKTKQIEYNFKKAKAKPNS